jgi:peptidase E
MEPGNRALDELIIELTGVREPRVLFLPTAGGDAAEQIASFHATFGDRACRPAHLSLFRLHGSRTSLRETVLAHDAVYVGGGSMRNMLAIWKAHGLDEVLREAWESGTVLAGLSAGAMCWFEGGVTMSGGPAEPIAGLAFVHGSLNVHTDGEPRRLPVYLEAIRRGVLPGGWALDDGVGLVLAGGRLERVVSSRPGARALRVDCVAGELVREHVEPELLTPPSTRLGSIPDDVRELRQVRGMRRR